MAAIGPPFFCWRVRSARAAVVAAIATARTRVAAIGTVSIRLAARAALAASAVTTLRTPLPLATAIAAALSATTVSTRSAATAAMATATAERAMSVIPLGSPVHVDAGPALEAFVLQHRFGKTRIADVVVVDLRTRSRVLLRRATTWTAVCVRAAVGTPM